MLTPDFVMVQKGQIKRWKERGISEDIYSEPETVRCRVNFRRRLVKAMSGGTIEEVVSVGQVFFPAGIRLDPKDRFIFGDMEYGVISCIPCYDMAGVENHVEVDMS